ncbi:aspartyl protease [Sphaerospermopsis torques-reginae]|uniref:Aspartyl protease n=1 Tax=Sphaerospermopsis torques-reginae ITEP-024 TaxID=984208 RepID=A0ABX8X413_9CYAN|nr:aspartyl protease [Sphaerospermopsis torques-reginae]QYX33439.1 aspartyl protease [Sphaerospermopsis torques-reginae ITEP-024]
MIQGYFGDGGQLFFEIELITTDGLNLPVDAMFDTGFTGFLAINKQDLSALDWQFLREQELITAQGQKAFDLYLGKVIFDNQEYEIPVYAGDELTEILLGSEWLEFLPLVVNFPAGVLTLG